MGSDVTTFKLRFTHHLNLPQSTLDNIAKQAEELAKRGEILKSVFAGDNPDDLSDPVNCPFAADPAYTAMAQARAWYSGGGFYCENGEIFLKVKSKSKLEGS